MRSVLIYATILVLGIGLSWQQYTSDEAPAKEGEVLVDGKPDDLERVHFKAPDLDVNFEMRSDDLGRFPWIVTSVTKNKKKDGVEVSETTLSTFKGGTPATDFVAMVAPFYAMRALEGVDDAKIESFGLKTPDTTMTVVVGGKERGFDLGGETYGAKDRYVRDQATGKFYVVDDEIFKKMKFAATRLPERSLTSPKPEEIDSVTLVKGAAVVEWIHKNKEDKAADFWERQQAPTAADATAKAGAKDETFANWIDKMLKVKSTAYVQATDGVTEGPVVFELTVKPAGKPAEIVSFFQSGDNYYAKSNFTRGLVKLTRSAIEDVGAEVDDILAGKTPPEKPKPVRPTPPEGGHAPPMMGGDPTNPHAAPPMGRPMMPPRPGMPAPPPPPAPSK